MIHNNLNIPFLAKLPFIDADDSPFSYSSAK